MSTIFKVNKINYDLTNGLSAYWKLDETSGNRIDSSGNGIDLTENGTVSYTNGIINNSAILPGDSVSWLQSNITINFSSDFTVSAWLKITSIVGGSGNWNIYYRTKSDGFYGLELGFTDINGGIKLTFEVPYSNGPFVLDNVNFNTGEWYHIVFIRKNNSYYWYINGVYYDTTVSFSNDMTGDVVILGNNGSNSNEFNGEIDETGVWTRALSISELSILYNNGLGNTYPFVSYTEPTLTTNLKGYWNLDDTSYTDSTGNGYTLTNNNGVYQGTGIISGDAVFSGQNNGDPNDNTSGSYLTSNTFDIEGSNRMSISVWVKMTDLNVNQALVGQFTGFGPGGAWILYYFKDYGSGNSFGFVLNNNHQINSTTNPSIDTWYHLVATYDGNKMKLYINGVLESSLDYSGSLGIYGRQFMMGWDNSYGDYLNGQLDEVGVWTRDLNQNEVTALYNAGAGLAYPLPYTPPVPKSPFIISKGIPTIKSKIKSSFVTLISELKAYYKLDDDGYGNVNLIDSTVNNNTLTNNNNATLGIGKINGAVVLDSALGQTLSNSSIITPTGNHPFSFSAWIKLNEDYTFMVLSYGTPGTNQAVGLYIPTNLPLEVNLNFWNNGVGNIPISANEWHHVVGTYDGNTARIYVDGSLGDSLVINLDIGVGNFHINQWVNGSMGTGICSVDEVGIWARALTPTEITQLYNNGSGLTYPFN